jgi:predicted  nucleic acid-binding Zn-ribbon protein
MLANVASLGSPTAIARLLAVAANARNGSDVNELGRRLTALLVLLALLATLSFALYDARLLRATANVGASASIWQQAWHSASSPVGDAMDAWMLWVYFCKALAELQGIKTREVLGAFVEGTFTAIWKTVWQPPDRAAYCLAAAFSFTDPSSFAQDCAVICASLLVVAAFVACMVSPSCSMLFLDTTRSISCCVQARIKQVRTRVICTFLALLAVSSVTASIFFGFLQVGAARILPATGPILFVAPSVVLYLSLCVMVLLTFAPDLFRSKDIVVSSDSLDNKELSKSVFSSWAGGAAKGATPLSWFGRLFSILNVLVVVIFKWAVLPYYVNDNFTLLAVAINVVCALILAEYVNNDSTIAFSSWGRVLGGGKQPGEAVKTGLKTLAALYRKLQASLGEQIADLEAQAKPVPASLHERTAVAVQAVQDLKDQQASLNKLEDTLKTDVAECRNELKIAQLQNRAHLAETSPADEKIAESTEVALKAVDCLEHAERNLRDGTALFASITKELVKAVSEMHEASHNLVSAQQVESSVQNQIVRLRSEIDEAYERMVGDQEVAGAAPAAESAAGGGGGGAAAGGGGGGGGDAAAKVRQRRQGSTN